MPTIRRSLTLLCHQPGSSWVLGPARCGFGRLGTERGPDGGAGHLFLIGLVLYFYETTQPVRSLLRPSVHASLRRWEPGCGQYQASEGEGFFCQDHERSMDQGPRCKMILLKGHTYSLSFSRPHRHQGGFRTPHSGGYLPSIWKRAGCSWTPSLVHNVPALYNYISAFTSS